ncbi:MAG: hypothetical protein CW338_05035 [Clostridiales bacterium]|nr:hypothetical protein [Clostridiales bacterium]
MKLKYELEILDMGDSFTAVPVGEGAENYHGVLRMNGSSREIIELLQEDKSVEQIVDALSAKYDENTREEIAAMVASVVDKLRAEGFIAE